MKRIIFSILLIALFSSIVLAEKYEYKCANKWEELNARHISVDIWLNKYGIEGWELVTVVFYPGNLQEEFSTIFYFKRRIK